MKTTVRCYYKNDKTKVHEDVQQQEFYIPPVKE